MKPALRPEPGKRGQRPAVDGSGERIGARSIGDDYNDWHTIIWRV
jgi:hypothetical protein